jgi:hypothetical protein
MVLSLVRTGGLVTRRKEGQNPKSGGPEDPSKRVFLERLAVGLAAAAGGALFLPSVPGFPSEDLPISRIWSGGSGLPEVPNIPGAEDLCQGWRRLRAEFTHRKDQGDEWGMGREGDCEDFVLRLFFQDPNLRGRYNGQLIMIRWERELWTGSTFGEILVEAEKKGHMGLVLFQPESCQYFFTDIGGILGPFDSHSAVISSVIENYRRTEPVVGAFLLRQRPIVITAFSLPKSFPAGGTAELRDLFFSGGVILHQEP